MAGIMDQISLVADKDTLVHIHGETGTGKELIAKRIHAAGRRKNGPFVALNCSTLPEALVESEMFGYVKGAFTDAAADSGGFFSRADTGTLFLDEISEMPPGMQSKLLRVIEQNEFYPVGSDRPQRVDVRIITASNKDLRREAESGRFRKDLFFRIYVVSIDLPPLRDRKEDIGLLAGHFLGVFCARMNKKIDGFSPEAMQMLIRYDWPGNVRELRNTVESAVALTYGALIGEEMISFPGSRPPGEIREYDTARRRFDKEYLLDLLAQAGGNISQAAAWSGKSRARLYEMMKKSGIDPKDHRK